MRYLIELTVLFFVFGAKAQEQTPIGCYEPGKCEHSQLVSIEVDVPNVDECLEFCNSTGDDCLYFSYDGSTDICYAYATCDDLSIDPCFGCQSGDFNCTKQPCFANGTCIGNDVGITIETTQEGCREECLGNGDCEYFSYDKENNLCILYEDCDIDETCLTCVYGSRDCHIADGGFTKILIVGGHINAAMVDVELIDMASSLTCDDPADYPMPIHGYVAAFINDVAWFCGGFYNNICHTYNSTTNSWQNAIPMLAVRFWAASAVIKGGTEWWIVGGRSSSTTYLDSTEILRNGEFFPGVDLPENMCWPCLVSINNTHVFLAGGLFATGAASAKAYILELEGGQDWQAVPNMMAARWGHTCNLVFTTEFGNEIVVAGGAGTQTEIYSLDENKWRVGPEFPRSLMEASSVPYQEGFLVLGGATNSDEIYELILKDWRWEKKQQTLTTGRREFTAVMLPDEQVNCH